MATKILNFVVSLTALQSLIESGTGQGPAAGLQWTIVEARPYFAGKGDAFVFLDSEQLDQISSEDVAAYGKPHVVGISFKTPSLVHVKFTDRSNAANAVGLDLVVEETPPA